LFFMFYWLELPDWDFNTLPVGLRGRFGDKLLCEELTKRKVTLHGSITAYAENLGWKGDVRSVRLSEDAHFRDFRAQVHSAPPEERVKIADYLAYRFAESKKESAPLPAVSPDVLTFVRARRLFYDLLAAPSEGFIPQFLVAALLHEYRRRQGIEVRTQHPHAPDRYGEKAGDIEEFQDGRLVRAYEVTVRPDWKARISNFKAKMDKFGLRKYVIFASGINQDEELAEPAKMALTIEPYGRDIAVVDLYDVVNFLSAELTHLELRAAVNKAYEYLSDLRLCGREDIKTRYRETVRGWLDDAGAAAGQGGMP
jgi:hypothetical protein